jgi:hypothetical protein
MDARNRLLGVWLERINTRQIVLPRFQRFEAWGAAEISDLLLTVLRNLPAGSTLILEIGDTIPFKWRTLEDAPQEGERVAELLLDGQQRLTSLWRSLHDTYPDRTYYVDLGKDDTQEQIEGEESPQIRSISRYWRNDRKYPLWADEPTELWEHGLIPVRLLRPGDNAQKELRQWANAAANGDNASTLEIMDVVTPLREQVAQFNLPYLALSVGTSKSTVIDVFVKLNTRMVKLTAFDIVVAEVEQVSGQSLHDLVRSLKGTAPSLEAYIDPSDLILTASALLQDLPPNRSGYLNLDFEQMIANWGFIITGVQETIRFLEQERIPDGERLPTTPILAPLVALWARAPETLDAKGNALTLLRRYVWRAFFTDRYEKAAASSALADFRGLRNILNGSGDERAVPILDENQYPIASIDELIQAGWPKKRDRLARAILAITLHGGARDLADGSEATRIHLPQREYHHLFPRAHLAEQGYPNGYADLALNCTLVTWNTNRAIAAKEPVAYLRERCAASTLGEDEIRYRLSTHAIDYDDLSAGNYEVFLRNRAEAIRRAAVALCSGQAL